MATANTSTDLLLSVAEDLLDVAGELFAAHPFAQSGSKAWVGSKTWERFVDAKIRYRAILAADRAELPLHMVLGRPRPRPWPGNVPTDVDLVCRVLMLSAENPELSVPIAARDLKRASLVIAHLAPDAARYRYLRGRQVSTLKDGGLFAGLTPDNLVINGPDLDARVDAAIGAEAGKVAS